jgi:hypothetical protein
MAWHRKNFSYAIMKTIGEDGSIEWIDYPYYSTSVSNYRELAHHGFQFLKKEHTLEEMSFKEFYQVFPITKPVEPVWDCIGKTSNDTVVFVSLFPRQHQSDHVLNERQNKWFMDRWITLSDGIDYLEARRCSAVLYLNERGIRSRQVDLMLIDAECETEEYARIKEETIAQRKIMVDKFGERIAIEQEKLFYQTAMGLDGVGCFEEVR